MPSSKQSEPSKSGGPSGERPPQQFVEKVLSKKKTAFCALQKLNHIFSGGMYGGKNTLIGRGVDRREACSPDVSCRKTCFSTVSAAALRVKGRRGLFFKHGLGAAHALFQVEQL